MDALGIDLKLLIAQAVNFLILLFLLQRFAYKPIIKMLDERREKIEKGLSDADKAKIELSKAEEESERIREKAFKEANEILENAKKASNLKAEETIKKAAQQADKIRSHAAEEALLAKDKAMTSAKLELSDLFVLGLQKIVGNELDDKTKMELTKKAIKEL